MTSVFDIFAKLGLDSSDFDKGLNDAKSTLSNMGSAVGSGLRTVAKIGTAAVASASAGIAALGTMAVKGYADYEQLTGGVETLYKDSYDKIAQYAQDAYKTAGMAANEYMDMSIKTGAAMIASVGGDTEKAADLMNTSITDMADNVNKMGTNMEDVQNAYRGFSRGNFTMLDNLALGFSGTKEGMQQLLDKAQELTGLHYDINSYADIAQAIHEVQVEMGIAGTTAKEASETISGSVASMKSAWSNLVAGLANDNADLGQLIDNVVTSAETAFNNILPVAERALIGIGQLVTDIAPIIGQRLPELITTLLPQIIDTGAQFIGALGQGILTNLPTLMESAVQLVIDLANFIAQNADKTIEGVIALIVAINEALYENIPQIIPAIVEMVAQIALAIITHIPDVIVAIVRLYSDMIQAIWKSKDQFFDAVSNILVMILNTIVDYGTQMLSNVGQFLTQLLTDTNQGMSDTFNKIVEWLTQIPPMMAYYAGYAIGEFIKFVIQLPSKVSSIFTSVMSAVASFGTNFVNKAREMASNFFNNIVNGLASLPSMVAALGQQLVQAVENLPSKFAEIGSNIVQGIWNGISGGWDWLKRQVKHLTDGLVQGVKDGLKIKSPSRVFMEIGKMVDEGFAKGIIDNENRVMSAMQDLISIPSMDDFGTQTGGVGISAVNAGSTTSGYTQIINITSPTALTPYEIARQTRNATRDMVLAMNIGG